MNDFLNSISDFFAPLFGGNDLSNDDLLNINKYDYNINKFDKEKEYEFEYHGISVSSPLGDFEKFPDDDFPVLNIDPLLDRGIDIVHDTDWLENTDWEPVNWDVGVDMITFGDGVVQHHEMHSEAHMAAARAQIVIEEANQDRSPRVNWQREGF